MDNQWIERGVLGRVRRLLRAWPCHLVGGAVRDHYLGRPAHDLDLVVARGEGAAATLAAALPARLVPIGGDRFAATRLVGEGLVIDLWDRGESPMEAELARRDLTINSMAIDLGDGSLLDPHGGRRDLEARCLRATTARSFADDPLRTLRLARLAAELPEFAVDGETEALAGRAAASLDIVAAERRRDEFSRALRAPRPDRALEVWSAIGLYPALVGADDDGASARALASFERLRGCLEEVIDATSGLAPAPDRLTLFAALLLRAAGADPSTLLAGGYLSRREARDVALTLDVGPLPETEAAQRWLLHRAAPVWPAALCVAAASSPDTERARRSLGQCLRLAKDLGPAIFDPAPLLRGDEIARLLDLEPGPRIGVVARRLRRRQVEGRLEDRDQAVAWLLSERRSSDAD